MQVQGTKDQATNFGIFSCFIQVRAFTTQEPYWLPFSKGAISTRKDFNSKGVFLRTYLIGTFLSDLFCFITFQSDFFSQRCNSENTTKVHFSQCWQVWWLQRMPWNFVWIHCNNELMIQVSRCLNWKHHLSRQIQKWDRINFIWTLLRTV